MQLTRSRPAAARHVSDLALARHFIALADQTSHAGDAGLAQHFLDIARDLFDSVDATGADGT